jgi:TonB family protein
MRCFALRLVVALLTFVVGVTVSSLWNFKRAVILDSQPAPAPMFVAAPAQDGLPCRGLSGGSHLNVISGGVLNARAVSKPQPAYPPIAKVARAQGVVTVQVLVDECGCVTSAKAVSGHPLLQQAAVQAAEQAKFVPTYLHGQPMIVEGVLTYNFVLE